LRGEISLDVDALFPWWDSPWMLDLNDLRVFASVASLRSFSKAGRALGMPKSSVSRSVARLEAELATRLVQRTTREVRLTESGVALQERCADILARVGQTTDYLASLGAGPRGLLKVSAGIGFGLNVLSDVLPRFLERYANVDVTVDLSSRSVDLVAEGIDVAIRMGPMPDSQIVAARLGTIRRYLCAAPAYLKARGSPRTLEELKDHDTVEMPGVDGRSRSWTFSKTVDETVHVKIDAQPRLTVNDPLMIHRLVLNGAGVGCLSGYLCAPEIKAGRLVRLLPEWTMPAVEVNAIFQSNREVSPTVRAFVDFMRTVSVPGKSWQNDPLSA